MHDDPTDSRRHPWRKSVRRYINAVGAVPKLTREQEQQLAERVRDANDLHAARTLVMANLRLVLPIARRFVGPELPLGDLVQEGNVALLKGIHSFDPSRGTRLEDFAAPLIEAAIGAYAARGANPEDVTGEAPDTPENAWLEAARLAAETDFTDDYIESEHAHYRLAQLRRLLPLFDERTRDIVQRRWLATGRQARLRELARDHGISTQRVRQIQNRALLRLRQRLVVR